jgi:sigma-B regulation protein RsbU (phosphoserine phosphatase)
MVERLAAAAEEQDRLHKEILEKQKLDQELKMAAVIQQSFLPSLFPWSSRYRTNARTVPAEAVGGDFYDFVELSQERLGLVIGDVAGRGIAAAVYMARMISDFRAAAMRTASPREALERVNQQLLARSTRGLFVTMAYLVLDLGTGELCYSSAGHLPALFRQGATGAVEVLDGDQGLPLGIVARPGLSERRLSLGPRDSMLLVTDGVVEALSGDHSEFAFGKLVELFCQRCGDDERIVDCVFEEITRLSPDGVPQDDMTVLTLSSCVNVRDDGP